MSEASRGGSDSGPGETRKPPERFTTGGVRRTKFEPKVPPRRLRKLSDVKKEPGGDAEAPDLQKLLKESAVDPRGRRGFDQKPGVPARVAFGYGTSTTGRPAAGQSSLSKGNLGANGGTRVSTGSGGGGGGGGGAGGGGGGGHAAQNKVVQFSNQNVPDCKKKHHAEPLDYAKYYPTILPLRKPNSGRISDLDEAEFGAEISTMEPQDDFVNPAHELSLFRPNEEERLLFFQIPSTLPLNSASSSHPLESKASSSNTTTSSLPGSTASLDKLPEGLMGKLLVYKSGAVKLKVGEVLFEVAPGTHCVFAQELAVVNATAGQCCFVGEINQRVILTPDVDMLLEGI